jgi:hypothetical protein
VLRMRAPAWRFQPVNDASLDLVLVRVASKVSEPASRVLRADVGMHLPGLQLILCSRMVDLIRTPRTCAIGSSALRTHQTITPMSVRSHTYYCKLRAESMSVCRPQRTPSITTYLEIHLRDVFESFIHSGLTITRCETCECHFGQHSSGLRIHLPL